MRERIKYTNEPIGKIEIVADFLPSPAELALRDEGVKVKLALSKKASSFSSPKPRSITPSSSE